MLAPTFFDDIRDADIIAPRRLAERLRLTLSGSPSLLTSTATR